MPKFTVTASYVTYLKIEIEADDIDQAEAIAEEIDGGMFEHCADGEWQIDGVYPVQE